MDKQMIVDAPKFESGFPYESLNHEDLPHVVKFSGGRTSGMMLFVLLESGLLKAERGDVVLFNNTSAEHPQTYDFVRRCKQVVERKLWDRIRQCTIFL